MFFESSETEQYFYEQIQKHGISHVNVSRNKIWTNDDVDNLILDIKKLNIEWDKL